MIVTSSVLLIKFSPEIISVVSPLKAFEISKIPWLSLDVDPPEVSLIDTPARGSLVLESTIFPFTPPMLANAPCVSKSERKSDRINLILLGIKIISFDLLG